MQARTYTRPSLVEVGRFTELTRITNQGGYIDSPWGAWWLD
jgi:hypothetical protein